MTAWDTGGVWWSHGVGYVVGLDQVKPGQSWARLECGGGCRAQGPGFSSALKSLCHPGHVSFWPQFPVSFTGGWVGSSLPLPKEELSPTSCLVSDVSAPQTPVRHGFGGSKVSPVLVYMGKLRPRPGNTLPEFTCASQASRVTLSLPPYPSGGGQGLEG